MTQKNNPNKQSLNPVEELPDALFLVETEDESDGELRSTLSFSRSPTVLLTFAANRFTRAAARVYQKNYGLGSMDWRLMVMLTREPGATVARGSEVIGIDKAAVSRGLHRLLKMEMAVQGKLHANGRSRGWHLTANGHKMHEKILKEALDRQRELFKGFEAAEVQNLCDMLTRFLTNLEEMQTGLGDLNIGTKNNN